MSIASYKHIVCDGEGCDVMIGCGVDTVLQLRKKLKLKGWTKITSRGYKHDGRWKTADGTRDLCPACNPKPEPVGGWTEGE